MRSEPRVTTSDRLASTTEINSALIDAAGVSDDLEFVQRLLTRQEWTSEQKDQIESAVQAIQLRRVDTNLHLGVIGEFCSGKSTLINALMRDDLLKTDVLPATTAAATWLRHGTKLDVEINFVDDERRTYSENGIALWHRFSNWFIRPSHGTEKERLRKFIHKITTDEDVATQLSNVTILHPAVAFQRGLVIIDIPGTNAENHRHMEVAETTLRQYCDAAIVVIPADIPVSQTLVKFLNNHGREILHRCLFVVTKMDTIRSPLERKMLMDTIRARLLSELDISQVQLFEAAPRVVVDDVINEEQTLSLEQVTAYIAAFSEFERKAWSMMEASRTTVLLERLVLLLTRLMEWLQPELEGYEKRYAERHAALLKAQIPSLGGFIKKHKISNMKAFKMEVRSVPAEAFRLIKQTRDFVKVTIQDAIYSTTDTSELKNLVNEQFPAIIEEQNRELQAGLVNLEHRILNSAEVQLNKFEVDFKLIYQTLQTLGGKLPLSESHISVGADVIETTTARDGFKRANNLLNESKVAENWVIGGGAGAGAFLGTLFFPGVGTVVGAAIGAFIGVFFGPDLDELKGQSWSELQKTISVFYDQAKSTAKDSLKVTTIETGENLMIAIDAYFNQYGSLVKTMIERDHEEQRDLQKRRTEIERDINEVRTRLEGISKVREKMRTVQFDKIL